MKKTVKNQDMSFLQSRNYNVNIHLFSIYIEVKY